MKTAIKVGAPVIGLCDSGGARIQEGVMSLAGYADIFLLNVMASGVVPQITAIMGPSAGGAVYSPALTDWIFMVEKTSHMFITGPEVIKAVTRETVTKEELGGPWPTTPAAGGPLRLANDRACLAKIRDLMSFLPQNNMEDPPRLEPSDDPQRRDERLREVVPPTPPSLTTSARSSSPTWTTTTFSRCTSTMPRTSLWASDAWTGFRWGWWPTSPA